MIHSSTLRIFFFSFVFKNCKQEKRKYFTEIKINACVSNKKRELLIKRQIRETACDTYFHSV